MFATKNGDRPLTIAVAKGRMFRPAWEVLRGAGLVQGEPPRNLLLVGPGEPGGPRVLVVRSADVLTYVAAGVAQLGLTGKDVLLEREPGPMVQELADLSIGQCRVCVAAPAAKGAQILEPGPNPLRIATGLPNIAQNYFRNLGRAVTIIPLAGSVEIAPAMGLADAVVDIVETGGTLRRHGLVEIADVVSITTRLIGSAAALRATTSHQLWPLVESLRAAGRQVAAGTVATGTKATAAATGAAAGTKATAAATGAAAAGTKTAATGGGAP